MTLSAEVALDRQALNRAIRNGQVEWQRHALERLLERGFSRQGVLSTLTVGEVIEEYPDDRPFPSALILGWIDRRPLHVVVALDPVNSWAFVVTAYEPDLEHFEPDFKTRRKK